MRLSALTSKKKHYQSVTLIKMLVLFAKTLLLCDGLSRQVLLLQCHEIAKCIRFLILLCNNHVLDFLVLNYF